jgi:MFS transporter, DHA1 family, multidrug resistance protein
MKTSEQKFKLTCKKPNTISLLLVYAMPNTIIVIFSPCTMAIGKYFSVSISSLYYLSILAFIGFAVGAVVSPLISMRYGKKGALIIGNSLALISILGYLFSTYIIMNYGLLLVFRFFSVVGAGIAIVAIPAIINEYYHEFHARKMMFLISAIFCLWPGIVMGISGFITGHFGWQYAELFLLLYSLITFVMMIKLPETQSKFHIKKNLIKPYPYTDNYIYPLTTIIVKS